MTKSDPWAYSRWKTEHSVLLPFIPNLPLGLQKVTKEIRKRTAGKQESSGPEYLRNSGKFQADGLIFIEKFTIQNTTGETSLYWGNPEGTEIGANCTKGRRAITRIIN